MSNREPYSGSDPYIFISYAHKDSNTVLPLIQALQEQDVRIWFDEGIEAGTEWPEYIAERLENSCCVIAFLSEAFTESQNCRREINFSIDLKKEIMAVYLEEVALSPGMRLQLSPVPALHRKNYRAEKELVKALLETDTVIRCKIKPRMNLETDAAALSAEECFENSQRARKGPGPEAIEAAAEWVRIAALKGHEQARKQMGRLLKNSHYQPTGEAEWARRWYILGDRQRVISSLKQASAPDVTEFERIVGEQLLSPEDCAKIRNNIEDVQRFLFLFKEDGRHDKRMKSYCESVVGEKLVSQARCRELYNERKDECDARILEWKLLQYQKDSSDRWLPNQIAEAYEKGEGTERNIDEAIKWYRIAAESGNYHAMTKMGVFCETGFGTEKDLTEAFRWYQLAANQPHYREAPYYLSDCYAKGIGVKKSWLKALKWRIKAHFRCIDIWDFFDCVRRAKYDREWNLEHYSAK